VKTTLLLAIAAAAGLSFVTGVNAADLFTYEYQPTET
jgi:hypothetical protein